MRSQVSLALAAIPLALSVFSLTSSASADESTERVFGGDWRQPSRKSTERFASPQHFAAELRFGGYYPRVDNELSGGTPYKSVFGDSPKFYIGLELDWQALRIPYVGTIGPGLGWGFTESSATALVSGTETESGVDTSLTIMPMQLMAVIRVDELMRRTDFPLVPYAKFGFGFATWSASTTSGVSNVGGVEGRGTTWGTHLALGGMIALNWIDRSAAASMDEQSGVNHAYVFGEWMNAMLSGIGSRPQMDVGSSSWVLGVAMDF